jgi:SAM-dependent methyltransferase
MEQGPINPGPPFNAYYYWIGLVILALNCMRHRIQGYKTPRTFSAGDLERAAIYDMSVVGSWLRTYRKYLGTDAGIDGKRILELGPGEDLGVALTLLAEGAAHYAAMDAHYLLENTPPEFYDILFGRLRDQYPELDEEDLRHQLTLALSQSPDRLDYRYEPNFDLGIFPKHSFDIVFSQAAFEHIDDPFRTIDSLTELVAPGAIAVILIDFRTHTRWIRDKDPLNVYRYPDSVYKLFSFSGIPNRFRPCQYNRAFEERGWKDVRVYETATLADDYIAETVPHLAKRFRNPENQMHILTGVLCAKMT